MEQAGVQEFASVEEIVRACLWRFPGASVEPASDGCNLAIRLELPSGRVYLVPVYANLAHGRLFVELPGFWMEFPRAQGANQEFALSVP